MADKYRSLSPISHMHKRSEMYIGPVKSQTFKDKWDNRFDVEQSTRFAFYIVEHTELKWQLWTCGRYRT